MEKINLKPDKPKKKSKPEKSFIKMCVLRPVKPVKMNPDFLKNLVSPEYYETLKNEDIYYQYQITTVERELDGVWVYSTGVYLKDTSGLTHEIMDVMSFYKGEEEQLKKYLSSLIAAFEDCEKNMLNFEGEIQDESDIERIVIQWNKSLNQEPI